MRGLIWLASVLISVFLLPEAAPAAFLDGVESFSGTTLDTSAWSQSIVANHASITQNNGLQFNFPVDEAGDAEVVTTQQTVGVGQWAQADFRLNSGYNIGSFDFILSTNVLLDSNPRDRFAYYASRTVEISAQQGPLTGFLGDQSATDSSGTRSGNGFWFAPAPQFGTTYRARIDWLAPSQFQFRLFALDAASNPTLLGQVTESISGIPSPLYVALHSNDMNVTVDNVALAAVPEPSSAVAVLALVGAVFRRSR